MESRRRNPTGLAAGLLLLATAAPAAGQPACDYSGLPGAVWWGTRNRMTITEFASYAAPIYWFSPDEPGSVVGGTVRRASCVVRPDDGQTPCTLH